MFVGRWNLMPMLCYQCIDYFLNVVDAFVLVAFMIDCILLLINILKDYFFMSLKLSGGVFETFHIIYFAISSVNISSSTKSENTQELVLKKTEVLVLYLQLNINQKNSPEEASQSYRSTGISSTVFELASN